MAEKIVNVTVRGDKQFRAMLRGSASTLTAAVGVELERQADAAKAWILENNSSLFTNPTGNLVKGLWRDEHRVQGTRVTVRAGWGVNSIHYARVLEYGPKRKEWMIYPGKSLSTWRGKIGWEGPTRPTRALRWVVGIGAGVQGPLLVRYAKKVKHVWTDAQKRPHWKKAIDHAAGKRRAGMRRAIKAAIAREFGGVK